jgi:hypothetical protein
MVVPIWIYRCSIRSIAASVWNWILVSLDRVWVDAYTNYIAVLTKEINVYRRLK